MLKFLQIRIYLEEGFSLTMVYSMRESYKGQPASSGRLWQWCRGRTRKNFVHYRRKSSGVIC